MPVSIATNATLAIQHAPIGTALKTAEILAIAAGDDGEERGTNPFAGILPSNARARQPAANDDSGKAETEVDAQARSGVSAHYNAQLSQVMAPRLARACFSPA